MQNKRRSPLTSSALTYTWRQLAQRAGVTGGNPEGTGFEALGIPVYYANPDQVQPERPSIIVVPCAEEAFHKLLERPQKSLDWLPAREVIPNGVNLSFGDSIPVLFWGEGYPRRQADSLCYRRGYEAGNQPFAKQRDDGSIVFYADIVAATFFMLTRWEETVVPTRDMHDRFPATASVAYKQGFLERPIVDEYALILQRWLKTLFPSWMPDTKRFTVKLSHDIDYIQYVSTMYQAVRILAGDLLKRHSLKQAWYTIRSIWKLVTSPQEDVYLQGIYDLANLSCKYGLKSAFYFMAAEAGPNDRGYNPASPLLHRCVHELRQQGHEIGFHPGYRTFNDFERFFAEKARLEATFGKNKYGGRQHLLRFRVPDTWRQWEQSKLAYDSTVGYAEHEGFRCGTCHPFRPFDIEQKRELDVWEYPLIVMDVTLRDYRGFTPQQAKSRILELAQRCKQVNGTFTLLWHNSSLGGGWRLWAEAYEQVVANLAQMHILEATDFRLDVNPL